MSNDTLKQKVEDWNAKYPAGTKVLYAGYPATTAGEARIIEGACSRYAAVQITGECGHISLERVTPVTEGEQEGGAA